MPVIAGAAVVIAVLAAFGGFLLFSGSDKTDEAETSGSAPGENNQAQDLSPAGAQSPAIAGRESGSQEAGAAGQNQGQNQGQISVSGSSASIGATAGTGTGFPVQASGTDPESLHWEDGDLNGLEQSASESLANIENDDAETARVLSALQWVDDGIIPEEQVVLARIQDISGEDSALAKNVANLSWLRDQVNEDEVAPLSHIRDIAKEDSSLARSLVAYEESSSAATEDTQYVVRDVARDDKSLAQRLADSGEIAGGVSGGELADLTGSDNYYLQLIAEEHQDLAEILRGHQWSASETRQISSRASAGNALASPLYNDGMTRYEQWAMSHFLNIAV